MLSVQTYETELGSGCFGSVSRRACPKWVIAIKRVISIHHRYVDYLPFF